MHRPNSTTLTDVDISISRIGTFRNLGRRFYLKKLSLIITLYNPCIQERQRTNQEKLEAAVESVVCDSGAGKAEAAAAAATPPAPAATADAVSVAGHNLRPKRTLRHVSAMKQQAKRRRRNTAVAAGGSPRVQRTLSARAASTSTGAR